MLKHGKPHVEARAAIKYALTGCYIKNTLITVLKFFPFPLNFQLKSRNALAWQVLADHES